jgi:hypothetical protein
VWAGAQTTKQQNPPTLGAGENCLSVNKLSFPTLGAIDKNAPKSMPFFKTEFSDVFLLENCTEHFEPVRGVNYPKCGIGR